jgi:hypothetical protein
MRSAVSGEVQASRVDRRPGHYHTPRAILPRGRVQTSYQPLAENASPSQTSGKRPFLVTRYVGTMSDGAAESVL